MLFAPHKITIYNEALASKKGTPLLFLVAKRTKQDKFVKPSKNRHQINHFGEWLSAIYKQVSCIQL
jgi:hypothetical protein